MFSPDGKWIAYGSHESGNWEVYVRPYPGPGGRWQVSNGEGHAAVWSRKRQELLYATIDGRIMVADYETRGDVFFPAKPRLWTQQRIGRELDRAIFAVSPDGQRVLTSINPSDTPDRRDSVHVVFLFHFLDELKRRLP